MIAVLDKLDSGAGIESGDRLLAAEKAVAVVVAVELVEDEAAAGLVVYLFEVVPRMCLKTPS